MTFEYVQCPFCNNMNKIITSKGNFNKHIRCSLCDSRIDQDPNEDQEAKYIARAKIGIQKPAKIVFFYNPQVHGLISKIEITQDIVGNIPEAIITFTFGDVYKTIWNSKTIEHFERGITYTTLIYDHRVLK